MAEFVSPKMSLGSLNASLSANDSFKISPSNSLKVNNHGIQGNKRSFSPIITKLKTPEISPISKTEKAESSSPSSTFFNHESSPFAVAAKKKDDDEEREKRHKRYTMYNFFDSPENISIPQLDNSNLEKTLSVATILKDLGLSYLYPIFDVEKIDLKVFMTLTEDDLKKIDITDSDNINKILAFIKCNTGENVSFTS